MVCYINTCESQPGAVLEENIWEAMPKSWRLFSRRPQNSQNAVFTAAVSNIGGKA